MKNKWILGLVLLTAGLMLSYSFTETEKLKPTQLYNNKIFAVDSGIKLGKDGEVLLILNGHYSRGTRKGDVIEFD